jgi:hypothetical protein
MPGYFKVKVPDSLVAGAESYDLWKVYAVNKRNKVTQINYIDSTSDAAVGGQAIYCFQLC